MKKVILFALSVMLLTACNSQTNTDSECCKADSTEAVSDSIAADSDSLQTVIDTTSKLD
jgi:uncharacterized protein YcfL